MIIIWVQTKFHSRNHVQRNVEEIVIQKLNAYISYSLLERHGANTLKLTNNEIERAKKKEKEKRYGNV